jgi:hypothetical protein
MKAYKLQGKIDQAGHLVLLELPSLPAGDVEVIVMQSDVPNLSIEPSMVSDRLEVIVPTKTTVKAFQDLFSRTEPAPPDFDPDQARWEALKEKHGL